MAPSGLLTDLYELNMAASYLRRGMGGEATFSLFIRQLPPTRGFLVAAGLEPALDFLEGFGLSETELDYLGRELGFEDPVLDALYDKQSRATNPEERKQLIRQFEKRLLDEEAHYLMTLQWHRIIPHSAKVKGWTITPSHYLNNTLDTVWLEQAD